MSFRRWEFIRPMSEPRLDPITHGRAQADGIAPAGPRWGEAAGVFVLVLAAHMVWLGDSPLSRTEGLRVVIARQMLATGEFVLPRIYGLLYQTKPPLYNWILAAAESIAGHGNEWVWRLPSALSAALLATWLYALGGRWFGRLGGLVSAGGCVALYALWAQNRGADIDALNTLLVVVAALSLVEAAFLRGRAAWLWGALGGLALGAALLAKGPAALPLIVGSLVGPALFLRRPRLALAPAVWMGLALGSAMFFAFVVYVRIELSRRGLQPDLTGLQEAEQRLLIRSFSGLLKSVTLPLVLLGYGMPVSLALLLLPRRDALGQAPASVRDRAVALLGTVLIGLLVMMVAGQANPRYSYPLLAAAAPAAGAIALAWSQGWLAPHWVRWLRGVLILLALALPLWLVALVILTWRDSSHHAVLIPSAMVSLTLAIPAARWLAQDRYRRGLISLAVMLLLLAVGFAEFKNQDRRTRSTIAAAAVMRQVVPEGEPIITDGMLRESPEIFYYARRENVRHSPLGLSPRPLPWTGWVFFGSDEWLAWSHDPHLSRIAVLPTFGKPCAIAWYTAPGVTSSDPSLDARTSSPVHP